MQRCIAEGGVNWLDWRHWSTVTAVQAEATIELNSYLLWSEPEITCIESPCGT